MAQAQKQAYLTGGPVFFEGMETQADRVLALLKARGVPDRQIKSSLADACGISYQSVREWFTGDTKKIGAEHLLKIAKKWRGNLQWLVDGSGPMDAAVSERTPAYNLEPVEVWDDSTPLDEDEIEVPFYKEVEFAAGSGRAPALEITGRKIRYGRQSVRAAGIDPANIACALNKGRSMEDLIQDRAMISMDLSKTQVVDGDIYALDHAGELRVKYLYRLKGGGLRLRSHNREEYEDEDYGPDWPEQIKVLGWVWTWSPPIRKWRGR